MRNPAIRIHTEELIVDCFAGGGGASTGIEMALGRSPDIAINHDPEALAMHAVNHPRTQHYCEDVWDVDPKLVCGDRPVGLAWFSPDCTFHSKARGTKPFRERDRARRRRGLAWVVTRWARAVRPRIIFLENVEEFADWGPLLDDGRPDPMRRGFTFRRWLAQLRNCGYATDMRELRACDYGAPTSRKRLFVIARCDGQSIVWPAATHGESSLFERREPYRVAADCIDWSLPCPSIFDRKRPLAENTLRRIARGIRRYVIDAAEPFIVPVTHPGDQRVHSIREPFRTITGANRGEQALVEPFLVEYHSAKRDGDHRARPLAAPLPTQDTSNRFGLVAPSLIQASWGEREGQAPRILDLHKPLGTVMAGGIKHALVSAFLAKHNGGHEGPGTSLASPVDTVTARDHHSLVAAHVLKFKGTCPDGQPVTEPLHTVQAQGNHYAEVRAFLLKYYGAAQHPQLGAPLHTVTTKDRFALVTVRGIDYVIVDIGMRMLAPRELFRAQGFPDTYQIDAGPEGEALSKSAQVRMCGNSVSPPPARAIVLANFSETVERRAVVA